MYGILSRFGLARKINQLDYRCSVTLTHRHWVTYSTHCSYIGRVCAVCG